MTADGVDGRGGIPRLPDTVGRAITPPQLWAARVMLRAVGVLTMVRMLVIIRAISPRKRDAESHDLCRNVGGAVALPELGSGLILANGHV